MRCQGEPTYIEPLTFLVDILGILLALAMNPWVGPGILRVGGGGGEGPRKGRCLGLLKLASEINLGGGVFMVRWDLARDKILTSSNNFILGVNSLVTGTRTILNPKYEAAFSCAGWMVIGAT